MANLDGKPEIFHSFQGEGKTMGKPSVFIRLSLCNLYCIWCDTDYTWNWKGTDYPHIYDSSPSYKKHDKKTAILLLENKEILKKAEKFNCKNIILTGGEPLVQQKDLVDLLKLFKSNDPNYTFEIETNGTIQPVEQLDRHIDQYNISIKLKNSGVKQQDRIKDQAIEYFSKQSKANFKFVLDRNDDLVEVLSIIKKFGIPNESVYLMPQGVNEQTLKSKRTDIIEICKQHNFNYTDRLHIQIYGSKRGI